MGLTLLMTISGTPSEAKFPGFNKDESQVPEYQLPEVLVFRDGTTVTSAEAWSTRRRGELLELFEQHVYGTTPSIDVPYQVVEESIDREALGGTATRKQIAIELDGDPNRSRIELLLYLPNQAEPPVPVFFGLNFGGNHTVHRDPGIWLSKSWIANDKGGGVVNNRANEKARGGSRGRWPVEMILQRGYALATVYYGDFDPDFDDGFRNGVHPLLHGTNENEEADASPRAPDDCGAIGAWAWGTRIMVTLLAAEETIDREQIAIMGHSRLGKTALWAGAQDERVALVISNNSGCGGAALSRRRFGERLVHINTNFPHWFCARFRDYNEKEDELPVDQHLLISLVAPRGVYIASAVEDHWADPRGEFLAAKAAEPAYQLLGKRGLGVDDLPAVDTPVGHTIGYHIRSGGHDVIRYDWERYLDFADRLYGRE
ncbi:MAG: acetylxylan esterase [Planctomycetota bacterium]|nr:MAG: acetylxylan esterase [Planctomycetota bacterium]REJ96739.1 MAG: acetylxylan esterase [Planctomycetota bacterium]REK22366.1 MAG: acetylxylan esterase [Planctomycetota bacterium]REK41092.1 MAG: acetylxylan esterase [Planctomycetota bacterium]